LLVDAAVILVVGMASLIVSEASIKRRHSVIRRVFGLELLEHHRTALRRPSVWQYRIAADTAAALVSWTEIGSSTSGPTANTAH
jgi:hypothetical protein